MSSLFSVSVFEIRIYGQSPRDLRLLSDFHVDAVVDLAANELPAQLSRDMIYCRFPIIDGEGSSGAIIEAAIRCVVTLISNELRTMVACNAGMSRSPAISAVALAIITGQSAEDLLTRIVAGAPHDVSPSLWLRVKAAYDEIGRNRGHLPRLTSVADQPIEPKLNLP
jgi:hypothetical protein